MTFLSTFQRFHLLSIVGCLLLLPHVRSYPFIMEIEEGSDRCIQFNIPEDDDAHMVFLALPSQDDYFETTDEVEEWFVKEIATLTKNRNERALPGKIAKLPSRIQGPIDKFLEGREGEKESGLKIVIVKDDEESVAATIPVPYFAPAVVNQVLSLDIKSRAEDDDDFVDGITICLDNRENYEVEVILIMDIVLVSMDDLEEDPERQGFQKDKHLSPLEEALEKSIHAANTVLKEMKYMTEREQRMRVTADSINSRVQYFSVFSVIILLIVTYTQVTYLKRYFKKKKLM